MSPMKAKADPSYAALVLADNVGVLMRYRFRDSENQPLDLAKAAGVTLSTIQRVLKPSVEVRTDTITRIAAAFDLSPYQLFVPELDPRNPHVIKGITADERRFYDKLLRDFQKLEQ